MMDRFSQYDIDTIWSFLIRESYSKVAKRYNVTHTTIERIVIGEAYKRETRLVDPKLVSKAEAAILSRRKRVPLADVSYLDTVAF